MKKLYKGSCLCGKVQFEAELDMSKGTGRCNCSICAKMRSWAMLAKPGDIRVLGGDFYAVNIACLDGLEPGELAQLPVQYADGRNDNWQASPAATSYL
jgi:hypothetical protein